MSKRLIMIVTVLLSGLCIMKAQNPMEELIYKYADVKGARDFVASGSMMTIARGFIRKYPVAPIADDVKEVAVLKMERAPEHMRYEFQKELEEVLQLYEYYGKQETKMGIVDVYVLKASPETVSELVIYNPEIWSLNCLYGDFSVEALLNLDSERK